jgi:hypothetical protein
LRKFTSLGLVPRNMFSRVGLVLMHIGERLELVMWNRNVEIDGTHSRAICDEIGERLRISLAREVAGLSPQMKRQMEQLRELDEHASPSIVPS